MVTKRVVEFTDSCSVIDSLKTNNDKLTFINQ